jgi:hypothetical protein
MTRPNDPPIPYGTWVEVPATGLHARILGWLPMQQVFYLDCDWFPWNVTHYYAVEDVQVIERPIVRNLFCFPPEPAEEESEESYDLPY